MEKNSLLSQGPNHLPVPLPAPYPQELRPTCPTGVSGLGPAGPSAQLIYGKRGCKQRTRGRQRTKATESFVCTLLSSVYITQQGSWHRETCPPRGSKQCHELFPIAAQTSLSPALLPVGRAALGPPVLPHRHGPGPMVTATAQPAQPGARADWEC
jgi:hypothetical protein